MTMLKPKEMAERLNVTVRTLQRWDNDGKLKAYRSPTDRRYYTHKQYVDYIGDGNSKHGNPVSPYSTFTNLGDRKLSISFLPRFMIFSMLEALNGT